MMRPFSRFILAVCGGVALCHGAASYASSVHPALVVNDPGLVLMIDGKDKGMDVDIRVRGGKKLFADGFDFGFMDGATYTPIQSSWCASGDVNFTGGTVVDFALRNKGADGIFGTSDDSYFRLSDAGDYVDQFYFGPINPAKSRNPVTGETYYRRLVLAWDLDHDGKTDFSVVLKAGKSFDGMAPAPVPVPAAAWLFGSGFTAMALVVRRRRPGVDRS
jgi:hypothetical protein